MRHLQYIHTFSLSCCFSKWSFHLIMTALHYLVLVLLIVSSESYRILGVFNFAARSHHILGSALMKGLAEKGHDVTIISPYSEKSIPKNWKYREIVLTGFVEERAKKNMNFFSLIDMNMFFLTGVTNMMSADSTDKTLGHPNVQKLLNSKDEHFDLIIIEQFMNDGLKIFAHHYKAPFILFNAMGANSMINSLVANPSNPSYIPETMLGYSSEMTFCERLYNTVILTMLELNAHLIVYPRQNSIMKKHFPDAPHLDELQYNASLVLLNSHVTVNQPVPLVPNMIDIGGFHLQPPKELPKDLKDFLDNSSEGVIYFSLGSNVKSSNLPQEQKQAFLKVFSTLKQKVLWKFEVDLPGKPANVIISKWFPQQDILAHPNVKLFITHGGLLSTTETVYHGVPILAIPLFADQTLNANHAEDNEFGLKLNFKEIEENTLREKITALLVDPKFRQNAKIRSKIMRDNQNKPMDTVNYWVEYVVRHKGAPHLRSAALKLSWYKYYLLDVLVVLVVGFVLIHALLFIILRKIIKAIRKPKIKSDKKTN